MFEKLIESRSEDAGFKNRKRYFMVSSAVVGLLFSAAVVISIFAAEYGLGSDTYDMVALTAPPETSIEPEPPQPQHAAASPSEIERPIRTANIQRIDEPPVAVPHSISVSPTNAVSRPPKSFDLGPVTGGDNGSGPERTGPDTGGLTAAIELPAEDQKPVPEPPPVVKTDPPKPPAIKTEGVINGIAKHLPVPAYPPMARANNVAGKVDVQVTIDENGKVISAKAVQGHVMLRSAAEKAAWGAKFGTTYLSRVPVKVTGVIVYNFRR